MLLVVVAEKIIRQLLPLLVFEMRELLLFMLRQCQCCSPISRSGVFSNCPSFSCFLVVLQLVMPWMLSSATMEWWRPGYLPLLVQLVAVEGNVNLPS